MNDLNTEKTCTSWADRLPAGGIFVVDCRYCGSVDTCTRGKVGQSEPDVLCSATVSSGTSGRTPPGGGGGGGLCGRGGGGGGGGGVSEGTFGTGLLFLFFEHRRRRERRR